MSAGSIVIVSGVVATFLLFAVVLMWADRYSHKPRSQAASAQPPKAPQIVDRLAA